MRLPRPWEFGGSGHVDEILQRSRERLPERDDERPGRVMAEADRINRELTRGLEELAQGLERLRREMRGRHE